VGQPKTGLTRAETAVFTSLSPDDGLDDAI
jgi:hypothetical protein